MIQITGIITIITDFRKSNGDQANNKLNSII